MKCTRSVSRKIMLGVNIIIFSALLQQSTSTDLWRHSFMNVKTTTPPKEQAQAVVDLIDRLIPKYAVKFEIVVNPEVCPDKPALDTFEFVSNNEGKLVIQGTTGVAAALGLQHFLKYFCFAHISWSGDQLKIPDPFPQVNKTVRVTSPHRFRYYQNVCTASYSFAWWDWSRWERELDWMALNGINLPLAFNGQEAIWQRVYLQMGLTQQELDDHFGGPAFLAWARMGNIQGWGGPLPATWHKNQLSLQHKILDGMRRFGMTPVLPGFAGHVPGGVSRIYPNANVSRMHRWGHFNDTYCCTYLLDPTDPLFKQIGQAFIREQISEFGTNHIYNCDTFNEMEPRSSEPKYLSRASRAVFQGMLAGDPNAIWLMQGWLFKNTDFWKPPQIKALLQGVPQGRMIILDLFAEVNPMWSRTNSFYGQPFIWCMLHNFGGNIGQYGSIETVSAGPIEALKHPGSTMIGTGLTPEGIEQNDVMYELMNEMGWRDQPVDITQWTKDYSHRRYGGSNNYTLLAWELLTRSVYNCSDQHEDHVRSVVVMRPGLHLAPDIWYSADDVFKAWGALVQAADSFREVEPFRYDLVDVTRQSLQLLALSLYNELLAAYGSKSSPTLLDAGEKLLYLLDDMDSLLSSNQYFLLGKWLNSAKSLGTTDHEIALYEFNARNQITLWGPNGEIHDYANKMWGGMMKSYYKPRWELFISALEVALSEGKEFDDEKFVAELLEVERNWTHERTVFPDQSVGDSIAIAKVLHQKYSQERKSLRL